MKKEFKYKNVLNYSLTYLLIGFSGIPFFDEYRMGRAVFLMLLAFLFFYFRKKIGKEIFVMFVIAIYLVLFQTLYFGGGKLFSTITMISFLVLMPYLAVKIIGPRFLRYYRDVMVVIAGISIIFWVAVNVSSGFHSSLHTIAIKLGSYVTPEFGIYNQSVIIYTYEETEQFGIYRNPGPFHEPGAFSVFLMLAIISEIFITGNLMTKKNMLFFANLIATFSTAGFLGLFVIVGFYVYTTKRMTTLTKVIVSGSMLAAVIYLFVTLDFLGEKISSQMEEQTDTQLNTATSGRFLGARKALIVLYRYPLFGRGLLSASKASSTSDEAAGYGWITWVSKLGIVFGLIYMFFLYKSLKNYSIINLHSKMFAVFAFGAILAVLSGQKFTSSLAYFFMFYLPLVYPLKYYWRDYILSPDENKKYKTKVIRKLDFEDYAKLARIAEKKRLVKW